MEFDNVLFAWKREPQIMKTFNHPFILKFYDSFIENDYHFIVIEYANGGDLLKLIEEKKLNSIDESLKYFTIICSGLNHIHS
jgi:serine/threonine protein kinase